MQTHLPGYVEKAAELKSDGVDEIVCVSVNDAFVMSAWGKQHETGTSILLRPSYSSFHRIDFVTD